MTNWIKSLFSKPDGKPASSGADPATSLKRKEQGDAYLEAGDITSAEQCYRQALALDPAGAIACRELCFLLCQQGKWEEARRVIAQGIEHFPHSAEFHFFLGNIDHSTGKWEQAAESFRKAMSLDPQYAPAYVNLSIALQSQGKWQEATAAIDGALNLDAGVADWHVRRGYLSQMQGDNEQALESYRQAIALDPHLAQAHANIGSLFEQMLQPEQALTAYREALALKPGDADMLFNVGSALDAQNKFDEAMAYYRQALAVDAGHAKSLVNLARLLDLQGKYDEALALLEEVCARHPALTEVRLNKSSLLMRLGRFTEAWQDYEYREKKVYMPVQPDATRPQWLGQEDLAGKTILLHGEQGYGDILQFLRYTKLVAARGATVYLYVPPALKSLAASCSGVSVVLTSGESMGHFDYMCPLMSLPFAFKTELDTVPGEVPYLSCDPARVAQWRDKLGARNAGLRVGLTWAGNPRKSQALAARMDRVRSMRFEQMLPLLDVPGVEFFSLQLGEGANWQPEKYPQVVDLTAGLEDFHDTAALIENLDLVITVDTSVLHLAGALGKPTWLLDRYDHCFRWLQNRQDSPWYPTLRIFRQPVMGDWDSVVRMAARELSELRARTG
jgi:tetratricopeptide (TPR) repeat protein